MKLQSFPLEVIHSSTSPLIAYAHIKLSLYVSSIVCVLRWHAADCECCHSYCGDGESLHLLRHPRVAGLGPTRMSRQWLFKGALGLLLGC